MFLSLVRPDRISSPMTRMAAVTIELMAFPFRVGRYTASRNRHGERLMNDVVTAAPPHRPRRAPAPPARLRAGADNTTDGPRWHDPPRLRDATRRIRPESRPPVSL